MRTTTPRNEPLRWALPAAFALIYLYAFPYFAELRSANELPRIFLTQEIVDRGTVRIDARLGELGSRFDVATTPDGHHYSNKAPGLSFLAVPVYAALKAATGGRPSLALSTWAFRVTAMTLPSLLFLLVFWRLAERFAPARRARAAALAAVGLGSMGLVYGLLFFSHQVAAACVGTAFYLAVRLCREAPRRRDLTAVTTGLLAGLAILVDYQAVLGSAAVGLYLLSRSPRRRRDSVLAFAGTLPAATLLLAYHQAAFGSPWRTGYSFAVDPAHQEGVLGIVGPNVRALWQALLDPSNGLLVLSPWVLLLAVGAVAVWRDTEARERVGAEALCAGVVVLLYVLFVGSLVPEFGRAGWSVGPRYIAVAIPFAGWLAAAGLDAVDERPVWRTLAHALVLVGVAIHVVAAATYPHWPTSFRNPLYEVSFRALSEDLAPHSLGTLLGLRGLASLVPMFLAAALLTAGLLSGRDRRRWTTTVLAASLAAVVVAAYGSFPRTGPAAERPWSFIERTWEPRPMGRRGSHKRGTIFERRSWSSLQPFQVSIRALSRKRSGEPADDAARRGVARGNGVNRVP